MASRHRSSLVAKNWNSAPVVFPISADTPRTVTAS